LKDIKQKLKESKEYLASDASKTMTYVNSTGLVEEWSNEARKELQKYVEKDWVMCLKKITAAEKELKKIESQINKVLENK
jgi:hypothetical protein